MRHKKKCLNKYKQVALLQKRFPNKTLIKNQFKHQRWCISEMKRLKRDNPINPLLVSRSNLITHLQADMKWVLNQKVNPIRLSTKFLIGTKEIEYLSQVTLNLLNNSVSKQILKNTKLSKLNETNYKSMTKGLNPNRMSLLIRLIKNQLLHQLWCISEMKRLKRDNQTNPLLISQSNLITHPREDMKWLPNQTVNPIRFSSKSQIDTKEIEYLFQVKLALLINLVSKKILKNIKLSKLNETNYKSMTKGLNPHQVSLLIRLIKYQFKHQRWCNSEMKRLKQENPINLLLVSQSNLITQPREDMK